MTEQNHNARQPQRRSPAQRNRRLQGQYLTWLLIGSVILATVAGIFWPDREYSETENRKLAQLPTVSSESLSDGSVLSGLSDYVADQFPGRDSWISLNLKFQTLLGQQESNGVYLCQDGYLIQAPEAPNEAQHQRNLTAINTFCANHSDLTSVVAIIPNACTILADKLPENAPVRDQAADLAHIQSNLSEATFVDVTSDLMAHSSEGLFYKTDHHWTSLGAYYAFQNIGTTLGLTVPELDSYTVYPVSQTFEGTLSSKSGSHAVTDTVEIFVPDTDIQYYVTYDSDQSGICSMYDRSALENKDHYTVFFGGNYGRVDITTTANTGRCLLVFKDSYANCFMQFLYPYYDHITMIDPRYYYDNVENVVKSEAITDILFLYNLDTFLGDTSLADVLDSGE